MMFFGDFLPLLGILKLHKALEFGVEVGGWVWGSVTLPDDGVGMWNFELFEQYIEGMDAMIILYDAAGAGDLPADADLNENANTLNLLSLSSLKTKEVGPVSCTRYNLY